MIPTELLQREDNPTSGVVVAAGPGRVEGGLRIPMEVIVGDRIFYSQYVTAVDYGDERLVTMRANAKDVLWVEERGS